MKRFIIPIIDVLLGIYLVMAIVSFNKPNELSPVCTKVNINIADQSTYGFLNADEIKKILERNSIYPLNKRMETVSPRKIERILMVSPFVNTAECYKTKDGSVQITITQRSPIVRIKNARGEDYYIDENGGVMPNSSYTSDLIIATGNIDRKYATNYLSILTNTIMASDMWRNQIEQINILPDHGVELVPRVGDHIIFLGYLPESNSKEQRQKDIPEFVNHQFDRLMKFYKYGLTQTGWNRYERINLEFVNQIICQKQGAELARIQAEKEAQEREERARELEAAKEQEARAQAAGIIPATEKKPATEAKPQNKQPAAKPQAKQPETKKTKKS